MIGAIPLALAVALLAGAAHAVPLVSDPPRYWSGPGASPCDGGCPLPWALDTLEGRLPPGVLAAFRDRLARGAPVEAFAIRDGEAILAMGEAGPNMVDGPILARLARPEPMLGWRVGSYVFGWVIACRNPVVLLRPRERWMPPATIWPALWREASGTGGGLYSSGAFIGPAVAVLMKAGTIMAPRGERVEALPFAPAPPPAAPTAIPLPGAWLMLLSALALVAWRRGRRGGA